MASKVDKRKVTKLKKKDVSGFMNVVFGMIYYVSSVFLTRKKLSNRIRMYRTVFFARLFESQRPVKPLSFSLSENVYFLKHF